MITDGIDIDLVALADEYVRRAATVYPGGRTVADHIAIAQVYATVAVAEALRALAPTGGQAADQSAAEIAGAPMAGDTIRLSRGPGAPPANFYVAAVETIPTGWRVTFAGCLRDLAPGQFTIIDRPTDR